MQGKRNVWYFFLAAGALVLLTGITYQSATQNVFQFDDVLNITENRAIKIKSLDLESLLGAAQHGHLERRVLPNISFAIDWWRGGGDPKPFLWTNIIIHSVNALLLFVFLATVIKQQKNPLYQVVLAALIGAAFWSVHPIQVQSVAYIVQRMNSMAALFVMLSVMSYIRGRSSPGHSTLWNICSAVAFLLGSISKENAWITPLLILLAEFGICRHGHPIIQNATDRLLLGITGIVIVLVVIDLATQSGPLTGYFQPLYGDKYYSLAERLLTQPRVILFHFSQLLLPLPQRFSIEHDFVLSTGMLDPPVTLLAFVLLFAWCMAGIYLLFLSGRRLAGFFMLWVPVTLVIESSFIPLEMVFEHRMYLPTVGIAGLLALLTIAACNSKLPGRSIYFTAIVISLMALMLSTINRLPAWRSQLTLYQQALEHAPNNARVWNNLGTYYMDEGKPAEAMAAFDEAIKLKPDFALAYKNRGLYTFEKLSDPAQAIRYLDYAIRLDPEMADAYLERGNVRYAGNEMQKALLDYNRALKLDPDYFLAYNNRGLIYMQLGSIREAIRNFTSSIQLSSDYQPAYTNRGIAYLRLHVYRPALEDFTRALELEPDDAIAHYNLAIVLAALGQSTTANESFRKSCEFGLEQGCLKMKSSVP